MYAYESVWSMFWLNFLLLFSVMTMSTPEKADGLKALENAIERIRETITKLGGVFTVNMAVNISFLFILRAFLVKMSQCSCPNYIFQISFIFIHFFFKQPKVVTATDEADLARRMERAELENAQVDGDDEDENEDGMTFDDGENGDDDKEDDDKGAGSSEEDDKN